MGDCLRELVLGRKKAECDSNLKERVRFFLEVWGGDKPSPKERGFISRTAVDNRALGGVEQRDLFLARRVLNYAKLVFSLAQSFCFLRSVIRLFVNQSRLSRSAFWYTQDIYDCSRGAS